MRLRKWAALALGFGGLLAADATATTLQLQSANPGDGSRKQYGASRHALMVQLKGETIYISQRGEGFEELSLGDTEQAAYLRKLLRDAGAEAHSVSVPIGSMIVANGGASQDGTKPKAPDADSAQGKKPPGKKTKQPPKNKSGNAK